MDPLPAAGLAPAFTLFEGLAPGAARDALAGLVPRALAQGETLPAADRAHRTIYLVVAGRLGVFHDTRAALALATIGPGECAGELSALDEGGTVTTVSALEPTQVLELPVARLNALMEAQPRVALNLLRALGPRLRQDRVALRAALEHRASFETSATIDPLTGLLNRRSMSDLFEREIHRALRGGAPVSLLMVDIDHLGDVNKNVGDAGGDRALVSLANAMRHVFRPGDLLARHGGATFCALLPEASPAKAGEAAERLRAWVCAHPIAAARDLQVRYTVSIGVAGGTGKDDLDALIARAGAALKRAKTEGRNRVLIESPASGDGAG